jgi:hypothetical protein
MNQVKIFRVCFEQKYQRPKEVFVFAKDEESANINALNDPSIKADVLRNVPYRVEVIFVKPTRLEILAQPESRPERKESDPVLYPQTFLLPTLTATQLCVISNLVELIGFGKVDPLILQSRFPELELIPANQR